MADIRNLNESYGGTCALTEIKGIGGTETETTVIEAAQWFFSGKRCGAFFFSTIKGNDSGDKLRKYITDEGLGRVVKQKPFINHRTYSGSEIHLYLWFIDLEGFSKFWEKKKTT